MENNELPNKRMSLSSVKTALLVLCLIILSIIGYTALTSMRMSDKNFLTSRIKSQKVIETRGFSYKTWNADQVNHMLVNVDAEVREEFRVKLLAKETFVKYFFLRDSSILYYISAELKENKDDSYCRLVVRNDFFFMRLLNEMNLFGPQNHKEHKIDKEICNALYGYGKPVVR